VTPSRAWEIDTPDLCALRLQLQAQLQVKEDRVMQMIIMAPNKDIAVGRKHAQQLIADTEGERT
jgi:hypothetical protein